MAGMKKNVNFGLLILITATLLCFCAAAIYYQTTFKSLSNEYKTKMSELQKVTSTLVEKKAELAETSAKQETLESKYTDVKEQKESLEDQRNRLQSELDTKKSELLQSQEDLRKEKIVSATYLSQRDEYKAARDAFKNDLDDVCDYINDNLAKGLSMPGECDTN